MEGCRILARQFRDKVEAHQARAAALVGRSVCCPFDLHALLPVPPTILQLGPTHPEALAWLARHWVVTDRLRQVSLRPKATAGRRLPRGHTVVGYGFFSDGETPQAAVNTIAANWLSLDGFSGPLERLLVLARARQVDLARLSLVDLIGKLISALRHAPAATSLGEKANWVVMAAWLVQLRCCCCCRRMHPPGRRLPSRRISCATGLSACRPCAPWQPGWSSGRNWVVTCSRVAGHVAEARERILRRLAELSDGGRFEQFLPAAPEPEDDAPRRLLRQRSAWCSTLVALLEMAKQGDVELVQDKPWSAIQVRHAKMPHAQERSGC